MHSWSGVILPFLSPTPVTPCRLLKSYPCFRSLFTLHLPEEGLSACLSLLCRGLSFVPLSKHLWIMMEIVFKHHLWAPLSQNKPTSEQTNRSWAILEAFSAGTLYLWYCIEFLVQNRPNKVKSTRIGIIKNQKFQRYFCLCVCMHVHHTDYYFFIFKHLLWKFSNILKNEENKKWRPMCELLK